MQILLGHFHVVDDVTAVAGGGIGGVGGRVRSLLVHVVAEDDLCPVLNDAHQVADEDARVQHVQEIGRC